MQVLFFEGSPAKSPFVLAVKNGAAFDPADKWGVTYLMARMISENGLGLASEELRQELKEKKVELSYEVTWDSLIFQGSAPLNRLGDVAELVGQMLIRPEFEEEALERVRREVLQEVERDLAQAEFRSQAVFLERTFGMNPYGHLVKGTPDTLKNVELRDIKVQARRLLMPNQAQLALYFPGDREELFRRISRRWGSWTREEPAPFSFRPAEAGKGVQVVILDDSSGKCLLRLGALAAEYSSRDSVVLELFEHYTTLSLPRIATSVESTDQISAAAVAEAGRMPGYLQLNVRTRPDRVGPYVLQFRSLLEEMTTGELDIATFDAARRLVFEEFRDSLEDPATRIRRVLETELNGLGLNFLATLNLRLERITPELFQRTLKQYISPDRFVLVVTGPAPELRVPLERLGSVQVLN